MISPILVPCERVGCRSGVRPREKTLAGCLAREHAGPPLTLLLLAPGAAAHGVGDAGVPNLPSAVLGAGWRDAPLRPRSPAARPFHTIGALS